MIAQVTDQNAKQVLNNKRLVIMWFSGDGCGPCHQAEPIIKDVARQRWPNIVVAQAKMEENPLFAKEHNVEHVPTLLMFKNGVVVDKIIGYNNDFTSKLVHSIATHI